MESEILKYVPLAVIVFVLVLFGLEHIFPLRERKRPLFRRLIINGVFIATVFVVAFLVVKPISEYFLASTVESGIGLLHYLPLHPAIKIILGILLLDLSFYYWHRLNHRIPLLWRFHNVHHVDPDLDVSTAYRFHFVEILYSTGFHIGQILIIGASSFTYIIFEILFQALTAFHHSNIRFPLGLERVLNYIIVTPRMHGIHHSAIRNETDSNYSVIFRWWDLLHRSLRLNVPHKLINIGVPAYLKPGDNKLWSLIKMPFIKQKQYWTSTDGSSLESRKQELPGNKHKLEA